jgi:hypothetical protein
VRTSNPKKDTMIPQTGDKFNVKPLPSKDNTENSKQISMLPSRI